MLNPELKLTTITPDKHGDWLNQRRDDFAHFISVDGKKSAGLAIFANYSCGLQSNRDPWSYNSSKKAIANNFKRCIAVYNGQVGKAKEAKAKGQDFEHDNDPTKIKWDRDRKISVLKGVYSPAFTESNITSSLYRPFVPQFLYNERFWLHFAGQWSSFFLSFCWCSKSSHWHYRRRGL